MTRILIAELKQETSTFNPAPTTYDNFQIHLGDAIVATFRETDTELAGAFEVFNQRGGIELVPTMSAASVSGGRVGESDLDRILTEMTDAIRQNRDVDAAYICLHGAMAGETIDDPEGTLMTSVREILGDIPIVASLDLHAVITDELVAATDILVPFHTYPHIDQYQTGQRAARNLLRLIDGGVIPTVARIEIPILVRGDELITATGRFGEAIRMCQEIEDSENGLVAGVIIGNAFTDVPALQSNVLVTLNGDADGARSAGERIARFMWQNRELFQAPLTSLDESIRLANDTDGLTVFSDAADATASGASGDSNAILKGLLTNAFQGRGLVPIVDAPAAAAAFDAGVGATVEVQLGGTRDPGRFTPLPVSATVKSLHDGNFTYENGMADEAGPTAVLVSGSVTIFVTSRPIYVVGRRVFQSHGLEPSDFDVVVVKSPNGFRTHYEAIAARIVPVDVPGSTSANLKSLPFENCVRPIFPLDEDVVPAFDVDN